MHPLLDRSARPRFVGVVHLGALPGAPGYAGRLAGVLERAVEDARHLVAGGVDGVIVENFGDAPFFGGPVPAETVAAMARALAAVEQVLEGRPLGVNVLRNDARAALGLCAASGASFLRVNVHVGVAVTDQGLIEGRAADTLRVRRALAPDAALLADVHVKHATPLGGGSIAEAAETTLGRGRADALIVSGEATGHAPVRGDLVAVRERLPSAPLWIGSGLDADNAPALLPLVDGAIVGTALKHDGDVGAAVDPERVARLRSAFDALG